MRVSAGGGGTGVLRRQMLWLLGWGGKQEKEGPTEPAGWGGCSVDGAGAQPLGLNLTPEASVFASKTGMITPAWAGVRIK